MKGLILKVGNFTQHILGIPKPGGLVLLDKSRKAALCEHLTEELEELNGSSLVDKTYEQGIKDEADALIDLIYIATRGLVEMGFTPEAAQLAFNEVHAANMRKVRGSNAKRPEAGAYDAIKPQDWVGPNWDLVLQFALQNKEKPSSLNEQAASQTASQLVVSREELYGSFRERAEVVDVMTDAVEHHPHWKKKLKANHRHAIRMIIEKIGRIVAGGDPSYADNWKDIQGYANLAEKDQ